MPESPRIVLIHATRVAMAPIETAFTESWPEAETLSILEEGLSIDLAKGRATREALDARIGALADYAMGLRPDAMLFTCSSFGRGIEHAARRLPIPVLKPNEAMFAQALGAGRRIAMLYSFAPAAEGMEDEFREAAALTGAKASIHSVHVPGALDALGSGDTATHDRLVAEAAAGIEGADAVMLAHFSMSRAAAMARVATPLPVLTSPETAIAALKARLHIEEVAPC